MAFIIIYYNLMMILDSGLLFWTTLYTSAEYYIGAFPIWSTFCRSICCRRLSCLCHSS